jgi:hypothetical protein
MSLVVLHFRMDAVMLAPNAVTHLIRCILHVGHQTEQRHSSGRYPMFLTFRNLALSVLISVGLVLTINQASASENDFADSFASLSFISARAKLTQGYVLGIQLYQKMGLGKLPDGRAKQGIYSDEDLKQLLDGFDRIQTEAAAPVNDLLVSDEEVIHQAFIHDFNVRLQNEEAASFFRSKEVLDWAKRNGAFLVDTLPLSSLISVLRVISPEKYRDPTPSDAKELELVSGGMVSIHHLYYISEALNSATLKPLIPARFNLERLRKEEMGLRADAKRIFGSSAATKYQYLIEMSLRESERTFETKLNKALQQQKTNAQRELAVLVIRASYAANPYLTGACDRIKERLDPNTIENSNGNWEMVKSANGTQITPGSDEMQILFKAYTSGCYVKKNTVIARNLLEQWANAHHDGGKKAAMSHCTLAQWYRFGVGGPKDEATAARWEDQFMVESGGHNCGSYSPKPLIDPADPWRTI